MEQHPSGVLQDPLAIPYSRTRILIIAMLAIGGSIAGIAMVVNGTVVWLGAVLAVGFALSAAYGLRTYLKNEPAVVLDNSGIQINFLKDFGKIPWTDVTGTKIYDGGVNKMLVLLVRNPEEYLDGVSSMKRMLFKFNLKNYGSPIVISHNAMNYSMTKLEQEISGRLAASLAGSQ